MVTLRLQELAQERAWHLLSKVSGISKADIETYATEKISADLQKISEALGVSSITPSVHDLVNCKLFYYSKFLPTYPSRYFRRRARISYP